MNYIVIDLEWNQGNAKNTKNKSELKFEIIEIGAVRLDDNFKETGRYRQLIAPSIHKKIHPIIADITKLNESMLRNKPHFNEVVDKFLDWCGSGVGEDYVFCTYGSQDLSELQKNMSFYNCSIPWRFPFMYIDVQKLFGIQYSNELSQCSLETAIKKLNFSMSGSFHRAFEDAYYTSLVLKKIDKLLIKDNMSIDYYNIPEKISDEKDIKIGNVVEHLTVSYNDKEKIMERVDIHVTRCLVCGKKCKKKIRWFSDGGKYYCVAVCNEHGYIEGNINLKKLSDNEYFGLRKVYMIDETGYNSIAERKKMIIQKRKEKRNRDKE